MSAPIGPGDYLRCIDAGPSPLGEESGLTEGAVYLCTRVQDNPWSPGDIGVWVEGAERNQRQRDLDLGWRADRFVPIYRRDESLIARLLSDVPTDIPVEA